MLGRRLKIDCRQCREARLGSIASTHGRACLQLLNTNQEVWCWLVYYSIGLCKQGRVPEHGRIAMMVLSTPIAGLRYITTVGIEHSVWRPSPTMLMRRSMWTAVGPLTYGGCIARPLVHKGMFEPRVLQRLHGRRYGAVATMRRDHAEPRP